MNDPKESKKDPLLLDHDADGIQELDNNLPRWWVWLFYLCILFSGVYLTYYHVLGKGDLQIAAYQREMTAGDAVKNAAQAQFEATLSSLAPSKNEALLARGGQVYMTYCSPCHRPDAGGLVGPNLCDDYWIHGSTYADNLKVIINGVPEKGMLTWKGVLTPYDIQAVASYIYTLRGTTPPNPKMREDLAPKVPTEVYE
ncbi:MAG: c-type cytochrome [Verrucomicrobiales bacterium]|nr:c-type cytochrome [Verrucomicrobiales bacterium]